MTPSRYSPEDVARMVKMRRHGACLDRIAREFGCHRSWVSTLLTRAGVPVFRVQKMSPKTRRRITQITRLAREGLPFREVAARLGMTPDAVRLTVERYDVRGSLGLLRMEELAPDLNISTTALKAACKEGRLACSRWFGWRVFDPEEAQAARDAYAAMRPLEDVRGWLTSREVARELGLSGHGFHHLTRIKHPAVQGIRRVRVAGVSGRAFRYEPQSVLQAARLLRAQQEAA